MNIISVLNHKGKKIIKVSINVIREFEDINIRDQLETSKPQEEFGELFSKPKIIQILKLVSSFGGKCVEEQMEIPFDFDISQVYHIYCEHQNKRFRVFMNNHLILDSNKIPYSYA